MNERQEFTPRQITEPLLLACRQVAGNDHAVHVPVRPQFDARLLECYPNVARILEREGAGSQVSGWLIWIEAGGRYLNFVHHAIYEDAQGLWLDPTPQADGETTILFVRDERRQFEGHLIASVVVPLVRHPDVLEFCAASNAFHRWYELHTVAGSPMVLTPELSQLAERFRKATGHLTVNIGNSRSPRDRAEARKKARKKDKRRNR